MDLARRLSRFESLLATHVASESARFAAAAGAAARVRVTVAGLPAASPVPASWTPVDGLRALKAAGAPLGSDADPVLAARVDGVLRGLGEPVLDAALASSAAVDVEYVRLSSRDGATLFAHSAAHVLGAAIEAHWPGALLCDGPPCADGEGVGFFYEACLPRGVRASDDVLAPLEAAARVVVAARAPFVRLPCTRDAAAHVLEGNPFKAAVLARIAPDAPVTLYRCGPLVDLCRGPHVPHTGLFRALTFHRVAGLTWAQPGAGARAGGAARGADTASGDAAAAAAAAMAPLTQQGPVFLHRVHGIAFPVAPQLAAWRRSVEAAAARNHRVIGRAQELFFFHDASPGCAFLQPHGVRVYNALCELLRGEYRRRGYEEVRTPLLYRKSLWATSGHLDAYAENMYAVKAGGLVAARNSGGVAGVGEGGEGGNAAGAAEAATPGGGHDGGCCGTDSSAEEGDDAWGLKPMNCPGHCLVFAHRQVSYRDLPVRLADFSALHRAEASGALGGLTRLRRFAQDDAHIFCAPEQVGAEVASCLDFIASVYALFGFAFRATLSTRPPVYVGDLASWDAAEAALAAAMRDFAAERARRDTGTGGANESSVEIEVDAGGGAFYGPKIDVFVKDAAGREHQCATVQLDFNLPRRFDLSYRARGAEGAEGGSEDAAATPSTAPTPAPTPASTPAPLPAPPPASATERAPPCGFERPVLIHRAVLGSLERFMGVLMEHTGGKWPFWLSPRQVCVATVAARHEPYARAVAHALRFAGCAGELEALRAAGAAAAAGAGAGADAVPSSGPPAGGAGAWVEGLSGRDTGLWVEVDASARSVPKKVREAQAGAHNLVVLVGDAEARDGAASVRFRDAATAAAFIRAWRAVDAAGADAAAAAEDAAATTHGGKAPPAATGVVAGEYRSPLFVLPVLMLRSVCEHLRAARLS